MRVFILGSDGADLAALEIALREGRVEMRRAARQIPPTPEEGRYAFAEWSLDPATRDLIDAAGKRVDLTSSEFDLLLAFVRQPGQALSREALLAALRGRAWSYFDRSIDTLVARLRKKIDAGSDRPRLVRSVRGVGYVFCASVSQRHGASQPVAA
jgi:two-component system OmpR family response regulator